MSVQAMSWAMEQQLVTDPHACSVLVALGNHADRDGSGAFPSVDTIRRYTKLSERTIRTKLADLEAAGMIRRGNQAIAAAHISRADKRPVVWDLAMERGVQETHPAHEREVQQPHPVETTGCSSRPDGVQLTTERGARAAPKPSFNHPVTVHTHTAGAHDFAGTFEGHAEPATSPGVTPAGQAAAELRRRGYRVTSMDPNLLAAIAEGVTVDQLLELAQIYPPSHPKSSGGSAGYVIAAARGQLAQPADQIQQGTHHAAAQRPSSVDRIVGHVSSARRGEDRTLDAEGFRVTG